MEIVSRKRGQQKVETVEVVSVFMALGGIKAVGMCCCEGSLEFGWTRAVWSE